MRDPGSNPGGGIFVVFMVGVAQLAERLTVDQVITGSNPVARPVFEVHWDVV